MQSRIVAVSTVPIRVAGDQSNGLTSPGNEAQGVDVFVLLKSDDAAPTVAEVITGGKRYQPSEQVQFQDVNNGVRFDRMWAVASPVAPAEGATAHRGAVIHKLVPVLVDDVPTGAYTIDPAVYAFTLDVFTQPAADADASPIEVTDGSGFTTADVVYLEIGGLYNVTAIDGVAGTLTLHNRDEAAAVVSTSA